MSNREIDDTEEIVLQPKFDRADVDTILLIFAHADASYNGVETDAGIQLVLLVDGVEVFFDEAFDSATSNRVFHVNFCYPLYIDAGADYPDIQIFVRRVGTGAAQIVYGSTSGTVHEILPYTGP